MKFPKANIKNTLIMYLGLGPVFWLGPIEYNYFKILKTVIFIILLSLLILDGISKRNLSHNKTFVSFVILLFFSSIFGFLQSSIKGIISTSISYSLIFFVTWIFFIYFKQKRFYEIMEILLKATKLISYLCAFIVVNHFIKIVDWKYITELTASYSSIVKLADTGFSTGRTAWSNGLALYFIVAIYAFLKMKRKEFLYYGAFILTAQILSGGRGGLLISIFIIVMYMASTINLKWGIVIVISLITLVSINKDYLKKRFRFDKLEKSGDDALNKFTAGRLGHFSFAIENIGEDFNYFKGNGFLKEENKINKKTDIHFLWLKKMLEGGVILLTVYVLFVVLYFIRIINLYRKDSNYVLFLHVFIGGLITTLFEPNAIFGSLQSSLIWWASIAAVESIRIRNLRQHHD